MKIDIPDLSIYPFHYFTLERSDMKYDCAISKPHKRKLKDIYQIDVLSNSYKGRIGSCLMVSKMLLDDDNATDAIIDAHEMMKRSKLSE
jgi:hypothetical protein